MAARAHWQLLALPAAQVRLYSGNLISAAIEVYVTQVLANHIGERPTFHVLGVAVHGQASGLKSRLAVELHDTRGHQVSVLLLLFGMSQKFGGDGLRLDSRPCARSDNAVKP